MLWKEINETKIILASGSPRRAELLLQARIPFEVFKSDIEEVTNETSPDAIVIDLASQKANDVYEKIITDLANKSEPFLIIGSDTIVSYQDEILGKPKDEQEAFDMLTLLSDRTHQVYTGVSLIYSKNGTKTIHHFCECTQVTFYPLNEFEIREYIHTKDPLDKAGSYGIQGPFAIFVKEISGDYNNVVGLPIARLYQEMLTL